MCRAVSLVNTTGNDGTVETLVAIGEQARSQRTNVVVCQTFGQMGISHCYEILTLTLLAVHYCGYVCMLPQVALWPLFLVYSTSIAGWGGAHIS